MQHPDPPASTNVAIAERLRSERLRVGLLQRDLAVATGVSKTTQFNYETGERAPDAVYLARASEAGLDALYIVTGQRSSSTPPADAEFVVIPLLPVHASAGNGTVNEPPSHYKVDGLCFSRDWLRARGLNAKSLAVINVRGSSMDGVLSHGDQVLIDTADREPRSGVVYVIRQGDELLVKYCMLLPGGMLRVSSANPTYPPYDVDLSKTPDVAIVGRVVASMHEW